MSARQHVPEPERRRSSRVSPRELGELRSRRELTRRRTRVARIDLGLGVLAALLLLALSPGLAITALVAAILLVLVAGSALLERRRARSHEDPL